MEHITLLVQNDGYYFEWLGKSLDTYINKYDKILLGSDFNAQENEPAIDGFLNLYNQKNIVNEKTCFKSLQNPSSIDLFLTNSNKSFQHTTAISAGISAFHKMVITVMKTTFAKAKPKEILYRSYKHFDNTRFRGDLKRELYSDNNNINVYSYFEKTYLKVLNKYAPMKKKVVRANEVPYMTKALRKANAARSRLEHRVHKTRTEESINAFKKRKNYCSKLYNKRKKEILR